MQLHTDGLVAGACRRAVRSQRGGSRLALLQPGLVFAPILVFRRGRARVRVQLHQGQIGRRAPPENSAAVHRQRDHRKVASAELSKRVDHCSMFQATVVKLSLDFETFGTS